MRKLLIFLLIFCLSFSGAWALSCESSPAPVYNPLNKIYWSCVTNETTTCFSSVEYGDDLVSALPYPKWNEDNSEVIEGFECDGVCSVEFSREDLRTDRNVTFKVRCGVDTVELVVTPDLNGALSSEVVMDRTIWFKENIAYFVGIFFILVLLVLFVSSLIKRAR